MSPEHCQGAELTASSDQYSLGVIAYEMLTGAPPFIGNSPFEIMRHHCESDPRPLDRLGDSYEKLGDIVLRMLAKAPGDRHTTLRLLVHELEHALPVGTSNLDIANSSYIRCLKDVPLIDLFYDRFRNQPGVKDVFKNTEMGHQANMLRGALTTIFTRGVESDQGQDTIRRITQKHAGLDLTTLYGVFVETFLATVREHDDEWNSHVEEAWKQVLNNFVEQLTRAHIQNPPEFV
jgi:serine/threonine protein kinase